MFMRARQGLFYGRTPRWVDPQPLDQCAAAAGGWPTATEGEQGSRIPPAGGMLMRAGREHWQRADRPFVPLCRGELKGPLPNTATLWASGVIGPQFTPFLHAC